MRAAGPDAPLGVASLPETAAAPDVDDAVDASPPSPPSSPPTSPEVAARLRDRARAVLSALAARDVNALAAMANPARGVRFSPYSYVDTEADVVLSPAELRGALRRAQVRT